MGLLDYLTTHTLDEDYAFVSERKACGTAPHPSAASGWSAP